MDSGNQDPNPNPNPNPSPLPNAPSPKPNDTVPYSEEPIVVQADTASFKHVVQFYTGSPQTVASASKNLRILQPMNPQQLERGGPSSGDVDTGADWRDGLPLLLSLRIRNRAQLAQVIYANPQVDVPVVTALTTAEVAEEKLYNQATGQHDYLMSINDFIQKIPLTCTSEVLQGSQWSPQLLLELPAPSKRHKGEKTPLVIPHNPWQLLDDLCQRKDEVSDFLNKLIQQFFEQLGLDHEKQQHSSTEQTLMQDTVKVHKKMAGVDFSSGLVEVRNEMDVMITQFRIKMYESCKCDYSQVINGMEEWHAEKIQLLIDDFSSKINDKLDEPSLDQLQQYRCWLLKKNQEPKKEYLTPEQIDQACFRVSQLIDKAQPRILNAASASVDLTSQIEKWENSLAKYTEKLFSNDDTIDVADHSDELKSEAEALNEYVELAQQPPLQIQHQPQAAFFSDAQIHTMHLSQQQLQQSVMRPQQQLLQQVPMHPPQQQQQSAMGGPQQQHRQQSVMCPQQQQSAMPMHPLRKQHQKQLDVQAPQQPSP